MKYMHFNSSCSYTALAMLLLKEGIDTEDTIIALEMGLPWIFAKREDCFMAGPMLQGAEWFNLYLNSKGFCMIEELVQKENLLDHLNKHDNCMLGINIPGGREKHAVVFRRFDGSYHFYNPVREGSGEAINIVFEKDEVLLSTEQNTMVGHLEKCPKTVVDRHKLFGESISTLRENLLKVNEFCSSVHTEEEYRKAMNNLFRPLFLDGITMLELAGELTLADGFKDLQGAYMMFLRGDKEGKLADQLSLDKLHDLVGQYIQLIAKQ